MSALMNFYDIDASVYEILDTANKARAILSDMHELHFSVFNENADACIFKELYPDVELRLEIAIEYVCKLNQLIEAFSEHVQESAEQQYLNEQKDGAK